jgi:hypothetical protein
VMAVHEGGVPPILAQKHYAQPSALTPENLLREARRQKRIADASVPDICILDPDGDVVRSFLCFAHVTNQLERVDGQFEKGEADGSHDALQLIAITADRLRSRLP